MDRCIDIRLFAYSFYLFGFISDSFLCLYFCVFLCLYLSSFYLYFMYDLIINNKYTNFCFVCSILYCKISCDNNKCWSVAAANWFARSWTHLMHGSLSQRELAPQMASRSVQPLFFTAQYTHLDTQTDHATTTCDICSNRPHHAQRPNNNNNNNNNNQKALTRGRIDHFNNTYSRPWILQFPIQICISATGSHVAS